MRPHEGVDAGQRGIDGATEANATSARSSIHVEPTGNFTSAVGGPPQYDELSHPNVESGQIAHDAAVRDEHQRRSVTLLGDRVLDVLDLPASKLSVIERAEQCAPLFDSPEGEPGRVEATAAGTRQHRADRDPLLAKRLANLSGLTSPALVQVALRRAVVELCVRRIEPAGSEAVAQHHDGARRPQGVPEGIRGRLSVHDERKAYGERHGDPCESKTSEKTAASRTLHWLTPGSACPVDHRR